MQRLEDLQMEYAMSKSHGMIAIEDLGTQRMSKSAKGTIDSPGKNVAQKSGLNRSILR